MSSKRTQGRAPMWFVAVAVLALLLLVAGAGVSWTSQSSLSDQSDSDDLRGELVAAAEQFFVEANSYDLSTEDRVADYKSRLRPLMTDAETRRFEGQLDRAIEVLGLDQVESHSVATVRQAAVEVFDDDSATVMVTGDVEFESTRLRRQSFPRWEVELRRVDGEWLVDGRTELGDGSIVSTTGSGGGE